MSEKKAKVRSKTPKLIGTALVLTAVAAGVTFSFQEESAAFRGMLKKSLKGWLSHEDINPDSTFKEEDVSFREGSREDDGIDLTMERKKKDGHKDHDLSALAVEDDDAHVKVDANHEERARAFLKRAEDDLDSWRLGSALSLARKVQDLKCSRDLKKKGRYLEDKARTVMELTRGVKPDIATDYSRLKVITLNNGNELKGVIEKSSNGKIIVRGNDNMKYTLTQSEIMRIKKVKAEDERSKIIEQFEESYAEAQRRGDPLSVFDVGILGIKKRLEEKGHKSVLEAYDLAYDKGGLKNAVQEHRARTLLAQGIWREDTGNLPIARKKYRECMDTYPDTAAAEKARKLLNYSLAREKKILAEQRRRREERKKHEDSHPDNRKDSKKDEDIIAERDTNYEDKTQDDSEYTDTSSGSQYSSRYSSTEAKRLGEADGYYHKALQHMKVAFANRPSRKSNQEFRKAEALLRKAIAIWERIHAKHNDPDIEMRLIKANEQLYSSIKLRTLA